MEITFKENENFLFHKDLHVCIPELNIDVYTDTYYFALDNGILPEEETEDKVKIVLTDLLSYWEKTVEELQENNIAFLPYDFSDQYLGALKIKRKKFDLIIRDSWGKKYGTFFPSYTNKIQFEDEEFNVDINSTKMPIEKFLMEIRRERDKI